MENAPMSRIGGVDWPEETSYLWSLDLTYYYSQGWLSSTTRALSLSLFI